MTKFRLWILAIVLMCTGIGLFFGYQKTLVFSASTTIKIGSLGVLSWRTNVPPGECEASDPSELLGCYGTFVRGAMEPMKIPIESETSLWRRLYKKYDIYHARREEIPLPIVYRVDFGEKAGVLSIETRGRTTLEATDFLINVSEAIIIRHNRRVEKHLTFLDLLEGKIQEEESETSVDEGLQKFSSDEKIAILAAIRNAVEFTYPTTYVVKAKSMPRSTNSFWLRVVSGFVIGLILAGFVSFLRTEVRNHYYQ